MTEDRKAKMLERVRALLAKADSTNYPAEADTFRAKADELMTAYAIEQWQVDAAQDGINARPMPESREVAFGWYWESARRDELWALMQRVATHCRCRIVYWKPGNDTMPVIGLPSDLDYFDLLFTHLMLQMGKGLEPKPNPTKTMIENLVVMKEAGMKWERIGELLYDIGQLDKPYTRNTGVRFTKLYTDYCDQHDRPRLRTSPSVYQRSFSQGFVTEIGARFREMREHQDGYDPNHQGTGAALALRDIKQVVDEAVAEMFGQPPRARGRSLDHNRKVDYGAYGQGREAGRRADIAVSQNKRMGNRKQIGG